jgi:hypothetical protein
MPLVSCLGFLLPHCGRPAFMDTFRFAEKSLPMPESIFAATCRNCGIKVVELARDDRQPAELASFQLAPRPFAIDSNNTISPRYPKRRPHRRAP